VWDMAEAFGRHAEVVNWWAAWPPLPGTAVTYGTPVEQTRDAISPSELKSKIAPLEVPLSTVQYEQVARFLNITGREYEQAVSSGGPSHPVNVFRRLLAKTWSDHRIALSLYQQQEPLLMLMHYEGTDAVNHLFGPYHPPYREGVSQDNFRRYWPTVANYYSEIDRLIGEWMRVLSQDTTVIILSGHGFRWDNRTRPRTQPIGRSALSDHRNPGIFIAYGNHVPRNPGTHALSVYDVVPSILAILGLPKSTEMPGNLPPWLFDNVQPVTAVRVVSYDEFFTPRVAGGPAVPMQAYTQQLQAIGHLTDPSRLQPVFEDVDGGQVAAAQPNPANWGQYAHWNNQGIQLRGQGKLKEAVEAFQQAINLNPSRPTPYLNMAMTLFDRQQYTAADEVFIMAVARGLPNAERWFADFAALYRSRNMTSRAIQLLYKGKQIFPQSYVIAANLGSALMQADRYTEGLPELERALGLQPSSTLVLNNLGIFYSKQKEYARALDFWNRSLTIDPRQPRIRQAADAARTQL
jgi:Tfp pilus assembly protein PilF